MKSESPSTSALEAVASHEHELNARVKEAELEASRLLEEARARAAGVREEGEAALDAELAALRRETAGECEQEAQKAERVSEDALARLRESALQRAEGIVEEVIGLVLPGREAEGSRDVPEAVE